jgi:hypothetical protein
MTYIVFAKLFTTFAYEKHTKVPKKDHRSLSHLLSKMFLTSLHIILEINFISLGPPKILKMFIEKKETSI